MITKHHFEHPSGVTMVRETRFEGTPGNPKITGRIYRADRGSKPCMPVSDNMITDKELNRKFAEAMKKPIVDLTLSPDARKELEKSVRKARRNGICLTG